MNRNNKLSFKFNECIVMFLLPLSIATIGCKKDETETDPETRSYSFTVSRNSSALANSSVSIETGNQNFSATTGSDGKCVINITNSITLPQYTIVTIDHSSIKPNALTVSGSAGTNTSLPVSCQSAPSNVKGRWVSLHHLGDDNYSGSENSQLQLPTEGIYKEFHFNLTSIPSSMPRLQIFARGVQETPAIFINGHAAASMGLSASNGNLSSYDFQLQTGGISLSQMFDIGDNVLKIHTAQNSSSDWDDIEFCGLLLY